MLDEVDHIGSGRVKVHAISKKTSGAVRGALGFGTNAASEKLATALAGHRYNLIGYAEALVLTAEFGGDVDVSNIQLIAEKEVHGHAALGLMDQRPFAFL